MPDAPAQALALDGLESRALEQRQDLAAARSSAIAAAQTAGVAGYAEVFSGAMLGAHFQRDADVSGTLGPAITVPIPIFDQGQAATSRAQAQFRQAQDRYWSLAVQIRSQVRKAHTQMESAREQAIYYQQVVIPLHQRIVEQTQLQYNGMFIGVAGLLAAKEEQVNAGAHYVESLRDYWVARAQMEAALGGSISPVSPAATTRPGDK